MLAHVGGRPFVSLLLDNLADAGIQQAILLTGYRADQVRQALGDEHRGMALLYSEETSPLGTAGAVRQALPLLQTDTFLLLNGDSICRVDLARLLARHNRHHADVTLTVAHVADASRFGRVEMKAHGRVSRFVEKQDNAGPGWINAGVYVLKKALFQEIPLVEYCSLERELLPVWVNSQKMYAIKGEGEFLDIGTPADYSRAESMLFSVRKIPCERQTNNS